MLYTNIYAGRLDASLRSDGPGAPGTGCDAQFTLQRDAGGAGRLAAQDTECPRVGPGLLHVSNQRDATAEAGRMRRCAA